MQYRKIKQKKELLETVLRLNSLSVKYMILLEDSEEAYFAMFRIIEKIAKDEFGIAHSKIYNGYNEIRSMTEKITQNVYGIRMTSSKMDDFAGNFSAELIDTVFSDIYSKIVWLCGKRI